MSPPIGLIAGNGTFPFLVLRAARHAGHDVVVAAIHGAALGGGLEVALASHYRVAVEGAKLGLPEVQLGLLPGAGGTQRAARLIGAQAALSLMLSGRHVGAQEALRLGLVDRVGQSDDVFAEGLAYAHELISAQAAPRRTKNARGLADKDASAAAIAIARADTLKKSRGLLSPLKIVECVDAALNLPFDEGLRFEREQFLECRESPQRAGLVHAFFAIHLRADQIVGGTAINFLALGITGYFFVDLLSAAAARTSAFSAFSLTLSPS